ncbi:LacI family DNA-binding transcriptional regulator [Diplocloster hominis]|uniref:LacI family DNA-binding transcriptional regulator n=1 Tax=Diplocloster hominis TaxID=3079010 RepID=UPI0031B9FBFB
MEKKTVTIKDIAKEANVSVATVSRYLNASGYVDDAKKEMIAEVIRKLNYRPNRMAQSLKTKESKNIVLILPDIQNPFYSTMGVEVQRMMMEKGYTITLFNTGADYGMELNCVRMAADIGNDGVIFATVNSNPQVVEALRNLNTPVIMVNVNQACGFDAVFADGGRSTYLSTRYLIEMGHERIAYAGGALGTDTVNSRKGGYMKAMEEAGLDVPEEYIFEMGLKLTSDTGKKCGYYFNALKHRPTAVCCANDLIAMGLYQTLNQLDVKIPDEISVTGVDNIMYAELSNPRLTSVTNDGGEFARTAVNALMDRIQGNYTGEPREFSIDRELVIRDSVRKYTK